MPRPNYSIDFQSITIAGVGVVKGQAVTDMGTYWAPASTANLAASVSGGYDGIALATVSNGVFPYQCDGIVPADVTGLGGASSVQFCNVDAAGNLYRAAAPDTTTIGRARKNGSVALTLGSILISGPTSTATATTTLAVGDIICSAADATDATKVAKATDAAMAAGGVVQGISLETVTVGASVSFAGAGTVVSASGVGLAAGAVGYVTRNASARCARKQPPAFLDDVVGWCDSQGHLRVLPGKSRAGEEHVQIFDYGVTGLLTSSQGSTIRQALTDAMAAGGPSALRFGTDTPAGSYNTYNIDAPLRITRGFFELSAKIPKTVKLRTEYIGPHIVVGPALSISTSLVTSLMPPAAGNAAGNGWKLDDAATCLSLTPFTKEWALDGKAAICVEFFFQLRTAVTGGNAFSILTSSGVPLSAAESGNIPNAFFFQVVGSGVGVGPDNTLYAGLTTTNGLHALASGAALTVGTTYHVALGYDSAEGTIRLFVTPVTAGTLTLSASQAATGTVVQKGSEFVIAGNQALTYPDQPIFTGAPGTIDAIRLSDAKRYAGGEATPTTKWSRTIVDSNTRFILDFDEVYTTDVLVGTAFQGAFKAFIPVLAGTIATQGIDGVRIQNLELDSGIPGQDGGGIFGNLSSEMEVVYLTGSCWTPLYLRACLYGRTIRAGVTAAGPYGILQTNSNQSDFVKCKVDGSYESALCIHGNSQGTVYDFIAANPSGRSITLAESVVDVITHITDSEGRTTAGAQNMLVGRNSSVRLQNALLDGTYFAGGVTMTGTPAITIGNAVVELVKCLLISANNGATELVHVLSGAGATPPIPVSLVDCQFGDFTANVYSYNAPGSMKITNSPEFVVMRRGDLYEQAGGRQRWFCKRANSTQRINALNGGAHTTTAATPDITWDDVGSGAPGTGVVLTDSADTRVDAVIIARGATWSWTQARRMTFRRSGASITSATLGSAEPSPDTIGTVPVGIGATINTDSVDSWYVTVSGVEGETADWAVSATAMEIST